VSLVGGWEVILAIEYLHSLDVLYRDLKPENIVLDAEGHALLIDFGLSKEGVTDAMLARSFVGTPEYMAPEMVQQTGHGRALDWWTVGILLYEMLVGIPPFYAKDKEVKYDKILRSELKFPRGVSTEAKQVIRKLLERDPTQRLGVGPGGAEEIKAEAFFEGLDWDTTLAKAAPGPLVGEVKVLGLKDFDFLTTIGEGSFGKALPPRPNPNPRQAGRSSGIPRAGRR
jgi:serum/glucocorticoid-regulated kinase 2